MELGFNRAEFSRSFLSHAFFITARKLVKKKEREKKQKEKLLAGSLSLLIALCSNQGFAWKQLTTSDEDHEVLHKMLLTWYVFLSVLLTETKSCSFGSLIQFLIVMPDIYGRFFQAPFFPTLVSNNCYLTRS